MPAGRRFSLYVNYFFIFSAEKTDLLTEDLQHVRKLSFFDMCQNINPFIHNIWLFLNLLNEKVNIFELEILYKILPNTCSKLPIDTMGIVLVSLLLTLNKQLFSGYSSFLTAMA